MRKIIEGRENKRVAREEMREEIIQKGIENGGDKRRKNEKDNKGKGGERFIRMNEKIRRKG